MKTTNDTSDYLWYSTPITTNGGHQTLSIACYDLCRVYVNNQYQDTVISSEDSSSITINTPAGTSNLNILSESIGLRNYGPHYEVIFDGIVQQPVLLNGKNITANVWTHQVGLFGEQIRIWADGVSKVQWSNSTSTYSPLTWWKVEFTWPKAHHHHLNLALDLSSIGKGMAYLNGHSVGRNWNRTAEGSCPSCAKMQTQCDYKNWTNEKSCRCDCGIPSQSYYHIPRECLHHDKQNQIVLIAEEPHSIRELNFIDILHRTRI